jgi:carboxylesterase type B
VTGGTIEGVEQDDLFTYKGILFATSPIGNLRWKAFEAYISRLREQGEKEEGQ